MLYNVLKPLLFQLDAERAHHIGLRGLHILARTGVRKRPAACDSGVQTQQMRLSFANRVGLAAGLDKNGEYIQALARLGFGFIEVGTVTPRPQSGNPKPRLFRLPQHQAIINRMGFNNKGVEYLVRQVQDAGFDGILGINIGKNFNTPGARAVDDYRICFEKAAPHADYVAINVSSPNTTGLRDMQGEQPLRDLLSALKSLQHDFLQKTGKSVPLAVKIAPDLSESEIDAIAGVVLELGIEGVIATNTTISRQGVDHADGAAEKGGLSGRPLTQKADEVLARLAQKLKGKTTLIGVGGILSAEDARRKILLGADLIQVYSGLIYRGPELVANICKALAQSR